MSRTGQHLTIVTLQNRNTGEVHRVVDNDYSHDSFKENWLRTVRQAAERHPESDIQTVENFYRLDNSSGLFTPGFRYTACQQPEIRLISLTLVGAKSGPSEVVRYEPRRGASS